MSRKQKVVILLPVFDLGGAEKQGYYIAKSLQDSGLYEVEVWALENGSGNLCPLLTSSNLKFKNLNIPFDSFYNRKKRLSVYFKFTRTLRKEKINSIIPFTYHCNVMSATAFRFAGVKKCLWFQIAMEFHIELSTFEKIALKFNPVYASNSLAAGKFVSKKHGLDIHKVAFIPNPFEAVSVKMERAEWREKLGIKENELMLFIAANFFPEKDHETLIKGFYIALQQYPNIKLVLAGSQNNVENINSIKSICFDLRLNADRVVFIGASNDVPGLINASDICLLTSISEGSPNALIEYMGYGKPVVTSSIPSIVELVNPDYPYLFEKGNEKDLAAKLNALIIELNSENVANYTERNKQSILTDYTIEANFNAFHKILRP